MREKIAENIPLAPYTIYKIGGPARFFAEIKNLDELEKTLEFASQKQMPFFILGAGSNILISDRGFAGLVVRITGGDLKIDSLRLVVDAGVSMPRLAAETAKAGLTGFEWAIGIPGTVGGSVRGNAGCFGGEMKDAIETVAFFDDEAAIQQYNNSACKFGYRDSIFKKHPQWVILRATLRLKKGNSEEIQNRIKNITLHRSQKQDIGVKSCGCIFKNVPWDRKDIDKEALLRDFPDLERFYKQQNIPASYLIDWSYLKGRRVGRVFVSPKHANYFVNEGGATAEEVIMLISLVKDAVKRKFGIILEEEIQYVGF